MSNPFKPNNMKAQTSIYLFFIFLSGFLAYSCENKEELTAIETQAERTIRKADSLAPCITDCLMSLPYETISQEEESHLVLMREEELMAQEVYEYLYSLYNIPVFNNISKSENVHTLTVLTLLDKYGIDDPASNHQTGVFHNPDIQSLYNELTTQGSQSFLDALIVGITIEDLDIYDLQQCLEDVDNEDIKLVFTHLSKGSRNHMRAFIGHLTNQSYTYIPQYITAAYFNEIINSPWEVGNGICTYCQYLRTEPLDTLTYE